MSARHPLPETLAAFAAGGLPAGACLVVEVHLQACADCRREVARLECVGGALLADTDPAELRADALDVALQQLDAAKPAARRGFTVAEVVASGIWIPLGPRLAVKRLSRFADPGEKLALLRAAPGQALPEHGHNGAERLVVMRGAFADDQGVYGAGDLSERGPTDRHQPVACAGEVCICLSATEGPLRLSGLARWMQPLLDL